MKDTVIKLIGLVESHSTMIASQAKQISGILQTQRDIIGEMNKLLDRIKELENNNDRTSP